MAREGREAETKFWRSPELVKTLLPYLYTYCVGRLAECNDITLGLLQRPFLWNQFIERSISKTLSQCTNLSWDEDEDKEVNEQERGEVEEEIHSMEMLENVGDLAKILTLFVDPKPFLLDLLHLICEKYPPNKMTSYPNGYGQVEVAGCCNKTHSVSPLGFLILDKIETTLGSTEQSVEKVEISGLFHWLEGMPALIHRVVQQQEMVRVASFGAFSCRNLETAEAFYALAQNCQTLRFPTIQIDHDIGADGWAMIRKAIQHLGRMVPRYDILTNKKAIAGGRRDDLRAIWDGLGFLSSWCLLEKDDGPRITRLEHWELLEEILDTREEEKQESEEHEAAGEPGQEENSN